MGEDVNIGIIMNYIKRENVKGTYLESHFDWQIKTFWWTLGLSFVGALLSIVGIGILILIGVGIWYIYRIVKGWLKLNDGQPIVVEKKAIPNQPE